MGCQLDPIRTSNAIHSTLCTKRGAEHLVHSLAHMLGKQLATLAGTHAVTHKTTYLEKETYAKLSEAACKRAGLGHLWMLERVLELPDAAMEKPFFADKRPEDRLTLAPHQQFQAAGLSTAVGGLGLTPAAERRFAAAAESLCETLLTVLVSLNGPLDDSVQAKLPIAPVVQGQGNFTRALHDREVSDDDFSAALPPTLWSWALGNLATEDGLPVSDFHVLADHDASAPWP